MDIIVYNRYKFIKYKYILYVINIYSKYVQIVALINKNIDIILKTIQKIFNSMRILKNLNCDNEFNTNKLNKYFEKNNIKFKCLLINFE